MFVTVESGQYRHKPSEGGLQITPAGRCLQEKSKKIQAIQNHSSGELAT
jgi:hypothetical protein